MRVWSTAEVAAVLGISRTQLWRWVRASRFPPPLLLGPTPGGKRGWPRFVVEDWLQSRPHASAGPNAQQPEAAP